jgi:ATP-dependent DNA helicase Q4
VKDIDSDEGCLSSGCVIVYVWRQRDAEVVAENIQAAGVSGGVVIYHGGMSGKAIVVVVVSGIIIPCSP